MNLESSQKWAIGISSAYLAVALFTWLLPLLPGAESMSGVFLVVTAMPWIWALGPLTEALGIDSMTFNMGFALFAILLNAWVLFVMVRWIARRIG